MAKYTRIKVAATMKSTGMVPLFYHEDFEVVKKVVKACFDGGARLLEFTARGDFAFEVFSKLSHFVSAELPEMILGVGSITDAGTASLYMQMGANFIVTPSFREDIAKVCNRRKVLWSPGCGSLTEINTAEELGCEIVKLFPGAVYGPEFVKAIKGPQPWTSIMPTGGVSTEEANLKSWFDAGVTCVGLGSQLISKDILKSADFGLLENRVRETMHCIQKLIK
ncbi:bifunctional 4-hydroxy-2-oxoglutarate aldolase/2-dehydro-3-deoxy-phosphogluconate aldolase [Maribacter sp. 2308TA10-17]|uniref:bifunctional 4-hydroxy-2-oxoglutarate aldolase/2-dehydro-3-deoxy-phosphogluconate aldolase n=1 Tax=Maribacter sp. 2308TA10-17 TaxID=3386276 RepID=UPI0039BD7C8E